MEGGARDHRHLNKELSSGQYTGDCESQDRRLSTPEIQQRPLERMMPRLSLDEKVSKSSKEKWGGHSREKKLYMKTLGRPPGVCNKIIISSLA